MKLSLQKITHRQTVDTGMALTLVALLLGLFTPWDGWYPVTVGVLLVTMTIPVVWKPAAVVWFRLAELLSAVSSRIILTLLFALLVVPVGVWRRWRGRDSLGLRTFQGGQASTLKARVHDWKATDLDKPY